MAQGQQRKSQTGSSGPPLLVEVVQGFCSVLRIDALGKSEVAPKSAKSEGKGAVISLKSSGARSKSGIPLGGSVRNGTSHVFQLNIDSCLGMRGRRSYRVLPRLAGVSSPEFL